MPGDFPFLSIDILIRRPKANISVFGNDLVAVVGILYGMCICIAHGLQRTVLIPVAVLHKRHRLAAALDLRECMELVVTVSIAHTVTAGYNTKQGSPEELPCLVRWRYAILRKLG